jgi:LemA protein
MSVTLIILGVLLAIGLWLVLSFNRLVTLKNRAKEAWADIEVQLKRRYNLIPNLVETVKGYAGHEKEVFEKVSQARARAMGAQGIGERAQAENMLSETLKSLFAVSEAYPELKASTNFLELQRELRDTEDKVQASRRFYNTNVRDLNTAIEKFPTNMIASWFGFKKMEFFEVGTEAEKEVPKVEF